jgi:hypothetical protein
MILVQEAKKFRVESEVEAIDLINDFKNKARQEGYEVKKSGYTYKTKTSKGEIYDEWFIVDVTLIYAKESTATPPSSKKESIKFD